MQATSGRDSLAGTTQPGPPRQIACLRCGDAAELTGEKVVRESFGGNVIGQALLMMTGQKWKWKYRCPEGHEESLDHADQRLDF